MLTWEDILETYEGVKTSREDFFYGADFSSDFFNNPFSSIGLSKEEKQLLTQIKADAVEYYSGVFHVDMESSHIRIHLLKDQKERVVGFMKERLKWYNENGFLLS